MLATHSFSPFFQKSEQKFTCDCGRLNRHLNNLNEVQNIQQQLQTHPSALAFSIEDLFDLDLIISLNATSTGRHEVYLVRVRPVLFEAESVMGDRKNKGGMILDRKHGGFGSSCISFSE